MNTPKDLPSSTAPAGASTVSAPELGGTSGSPKTCANRYDLAFLEWFERHGWQIHVTPSGVDVWTNDDTPCPFRVTRGMIDRLEWSRKIERIFPQHASVLDYVWALANGADQPRPRE